MSIVLQAPVSSNQTRHAAAWAALGYVAGKEGDRDSLADGAAYSVDLRIVGEVDGESIDRTIAGRLTVGHETTKKSSVAPNVNHVIGYLLSKMNEATRAMILRELPAEYEANN